MVGVGVMRLAWLLASVDICVIPVKTGIQNLRMQALSHISGYLKALDSCFRRNDEMKSQNANTT